MDTAASNSEKPPLARYISLVCYKSINNCTIMIGIVVELITWQKAVTMGRSVEQLTARQAGNTYVHSSE